MPGDVGRAQIMKAHQGPSMLCTGPSGYSNGRRIDATEISQTRSNLELPSFLQADAWSDTIECRLSEVCAPEVFGPRPSTSAITV